MNLLEKRRQQNFNNLQHKKEEKEFKLIELQLKTFWWIFGFALFGGIYSIVEISKNIFNSETEKNVSRKDLDLEISKLKTYILEQEKNKTEKK